MVLGCVVLHFGPFCPAIACTKTSKCSTTHHRTIAPVRNHFAGPGKSWVGGELGQLIGSRINPARLRSALPEQRRIVKVDLRVVLAQPANRVPDGAEATLALPPNRPADGEWPEGGRLCQGASDRRHCL